MKQITALGPLVLTSLFALACSSAGGSTEAETTSGAEITVTRVAPPVNAGICPPAPAGAAQCQAIVVTASDGTARASSTPSGWSPAQLAAAYRIPAGSGGTVAIIDAYDNPNAEADLAVYRSTFGLPPCTTSNGCFKKVNQSGAASPLPAPDPSWAPEIALDLDMASAGCPSCKILLIEAQTNYFSDLGAAVNQAAAMGATVISNSYAAADSAASVSYDSLYYNHPGIAITASSGDWGSSNGHAPYYPAAGAHVIGVGGTNLATASNGRGWTETAWGTSAGTGAGAGCSQFVAKPSWQGNTGCSMRATADVSAVADPSTPVAVYDTYNGVGGWVMFGGTSVAAPLVAAIMAATGRGANDASWFYAHPGTLYDVTSGCSGTSTPPDLTCAGVGWDGPTGLGTLDGNAMAAPPGCGLLTAGQYLSPGQSLYSCDGSHVLVQQSDGNVVLYNTKPTGWVATWSTGTWSSGGHFTSIGNDGNFVVYNAAWQGVWQAGTWGHPGALLSVQDDGNMVVYSSTWAPLWASNTWNQ
jgi:subtilase family serine protease